MSTSSIESLEQRTLLAVSLAHDLNTHRFDLAADNFSSRVAGDQLYFTMASQDGYDLWTTDGTSRGTRKIRPIGRDHWTPSPYAAVGDALLFGVRGDNTLWRTEGTRRSTRRIMRVQGTITGQYNHLDKLFFTVNDPTTASKSLWVSDGTKAGTRRLAAFTFDIHHALPYKGRLILISMDGQGRSRFWVSDGTPKGTHSLNLTIPAAVQNPRVHNGRILFATSDGHLRSTDLKQIYDLGAGPSASYIERAGKNLILFGDDDAQGNPTVWKTDATPSGTAFLAALPDVQFAGDEQARLGKLVFFTGWHDGQTHDHLYVSDASPQGTKPFRHDLHSVSNLQRRGRRLFFRAMNPDAGIITWYRSDGTPKGTVPIKTSPEKPYENSLIGTINGKHVHTARGDGGTIAVTDASSGDTGVLYRTKLTYSSNPGQLTVAPDGNLYFTTADTYYSGPEPWEEYVTSRAIWRKSDNKPPVKLAELPGSIGHLSAARDLTFFTVRISDDDPRTSHDFPQGHSELWRTDGTPKGTFKLTDNSNRLTFGGGPPFPIAQLVDNTMYFYVGYKGPSYGDENEEESIGALWKSDGTKSGTVKVTDAKIRAMSAAGDQLYFIDGDGSLWTSDGTANGTRRLMQFADHDASFRQFIPTKRGMFFTRETDNGSESLDDIDLYFTDGTPANTRHLGDFLEDRIGYSARRWDWYAEVKGNLFFIANTEEHGPELWKSNGTPEGTALVTDIREGAEGSNPTSIIEHEGLAYFFADDGTTGPQLWRSNGKASGTRIVKKFKLDAGLEANPHEALASLAGGLVFQKTDPNAFTNHEIFFGDLDTGFRSLGKYTTQSAGLRTTPPAWVHHNGKLVFSATHPIYHNELWQADL